MGRSPDELLDELRETGDELPYELRQEILACDPAAIVDDLIQIARADELVEGDAGDYGPPAHAAMLLGLLEAESAIEPLVELVVDEGYRTARGAAAGTALQNFGAPAVDALVEVFESTSDPDVQVHLTDALSGMPVEDDRIRRVLIEALESVPIEQQRTVIQSIGLRDDEQLGEQLSAWLERADLDPDELVDRLIIEVAALELERFDIELSDAQEELVEQTRVLSDAPEKGGD